MKFAQDVILNDSIATSKDSEVVLLDQIYGYAMQLDFTGAPSGTVQIKGSNQVLENGQQEPTVWANIDSSVAISASGTIMINKDAQYYKFVKVSYTAASGSGNLKITYTGKG